MSKYIEQEVFLDSVFSAVGTYAEVLVDERLDDLAAMSRVLLPPKPATPLQHALSSLAIMGVAYGRWENLFIPQPEAAPEMDESPLTVGFSTDADGSQSLTLERVAVSAIVQRLAEMIQSSNPYLSAASSWALAWVRSNYRTDLSAERVLVPVAKLWAANSRLYSLHHFPAFALSQLPLEPSLAGVLHAETDVVKFVSSKTVQRDLPDSNDIHLKALITARYYLGGGWPLPLEGVKELLQRGAGDEYFERYKEGLRGFAT